MGKAEKLADLRKILSFRSPAACMALGHRGADAVLGGGLARGALHEVFAGDQGASAIGFTAGLAQRLAGGKPLFWITSDFAILEYGAICAPGLAGLGGDPARLVLLRLSHAHDVLKAASDILSCPHVGALVIEMTGAPRALNLAASRRLTLAANSGNIPALLLRLGAVPQPSAAETRWLVKAAPSSPQEDWGAPRFEAQLLRNRHGGLGQWRMEWDCENGCFRDCHQAPDHGDRIAASASGPDFAQRRAL